MSRAGYDIGLEVGKLLEHVFITKGARAVSVIGRVLGLGGLCIGALIAVFDEMLFDGEAMLLGLGLGFGGVIFLCVMHWIALRLDKKAAGSK